MAGTSVKQWEDRTLQDRQQFFAGLFAGSAQYADELLSLIKAPDGYGVYASTGPHYRYALFGRDALAVAEDLLPLRPAVVREIILVLVRLQGEQNNDTTEEEPGKIHHEYRSRSISGQAVPVNAQKVLEVLAAKWGTSSNGDLLYYGAVDTTPLFVTLACRYAQAYEPDFFETEIITFRGAHRTVGQSVRLAVQWLLRRLKSSSWGLLEFKRKNPQGLFNQAWKDSNTAYIHTDGSLAHADGGIASVEVQGYCCDALLWAARWLSNDEDERQIYRTQAQLLAETTVSLMWMHDEQFFAMGCDRGGGATRQIKTKTSNAGSLLNSSLLHAVLDGQKYADSIVRRLMDDDFLTPVGVRCRSLKHADLVGFADYHGSLVSWPKDTFEVSKGLRKWGFIKEADKLVKRLQHGMSVAGEAYEFFYVGRDGRPKYHYRRQEPNEPTFHDFGAANIPEPGQAWSISAAIASVGFSIIRK